MSKRSCIQTHLALLLASKCYFSTCGITTTVKTIFLVDFRLCYEWIRIVQVEMRPHSKVLSLFSFYSIVFPGCGPAKCNQRFCSSTNNLESALLGRRTQVYTIRRSKKGKLTNRLNCVLNKVPFLPLAISNFHLLKAINIEG